MSKHRKTACRFHPLLIIGIFVLLALVIYIAPSQAQSVVQLSQNSIGYIGCSNTEDAVIGYYAVQNRGLFWAPYDTYGGVVSEWAHLANQQYWANFSKQISTYGQPQIVWVNLCEFAASPATFSDVQNMLSILRSYTPNANFYVSPLNSYVSGYVCPLTGANGVQDTTNLANEAVAAGLALQGPILGPLGPAPVGNPAGGTLQNSCHPNTAGEILLGAQLASFFDNLAVTASTSRSSTSSSQTATSKTSILSTASSSQTITTTSSFTQISTSSTQTITITSSSPQTSNTSIVATTSSSQTTTSMMIQPSVTLNPSSGQIGSTVDLSGYYFSTSDTSCSLSSNVIVSQTCSVSGGTLIGTFTVANVASGSYTVTVTASPVGDTASTIFALNAPTSRTTTTSNTATSTVPVREFQGSSILMLTLTVCSTLTFLSLKKEFRSK